MIKNNDINQTLVSKIAEQYSASEMTYIDDFTLFDNSVTKLNEVIIDQIKKANNNIRIAMYKLMNPNVISEIVNAASRGIKIQIIVDKSDSQCENIIMSKVHEQYKANVKVITGPIKFLVFHCKYMVIDNKIAIVSTANIDPDKYMESTNFLCLTQNINIVNNLIKIFESDIIDATEDTEIVNEQIIFNPHGICWGNGSINQHTHDYNPYWIDQDKNNDELDCAGSAYYTYLNHIRSAKKSITIYMQVFNYYPIVHELILAKQRGVDVKIIVQALSQTGILLKFIKDLLKQHDIYFIVNGSTIPYVHAKLCIVDEEKAIIGSNNFSYASIFLNREVNLCIKGPAIKYLSDKFKSDFDKLNNVKKRFRRYNTEYENKFKSKISNQENKKVEKNKHRKPRVKHYNQN